MLCNKFIECVFYDVYVRCDEVAIVKGTSQSRQSASLVFVLGPM